MTKTDSSGQRTDSNSEAKQPGSDLTLFLCGDVMTGRGIDQILARPSDPELYESFVQDAREYAELAERSSGRIQRNVAHDYIWGDALAELARVRPRVALQPGGTLALRWG
jgi:poly-gamma-glutamate synthesis protein (capsule biosynthesis protein)